MASKKNRLIERAKQTVRTPKPPRLLDEKPRKQGYRVVGVSLYTPEADWIDAAMKALKSAGHHKATRSLVVREAVLRLQEALKDKAPQEILDDFIKHQAQRVQQ